MYDGVPEVTARSNGVYHHEPLWYRNFLYDEEAARGLDATEDLAAPGRYEFDLTTRDAVLILSTGSLGLPLTPTPLSANAVAETFARSEIKRRSCLCDAAPARRRRLHRRARRGPDDHRRLPVVRRLGPRHLHLHARPLPRHQAA